MAQPTLPHELVITILSQVSPRSLSQAATVCKFWYLSVQRLLYQSVDLYSTSQHKRFMKGLKANNNRVADKNMKNGWHVRKLILHTSDIFMEESTLNLLKRLCPLVTVFDYASYVTLYVDQQSYFTPEWKKLQRLPAWHEDTNNVWISQFGHQLTDTSCSILELEVLPSLGKYLPIFPSLVHLEIEMHWYGVPINITLVDAITNHCPVLESLCLTFTGLEAGDVDNYGNKNDWQPAEKLRILKWDTDRYFDPIWYTYLGQKYPRLTNLSLTINSEGYYPGRSTERTSAHKTSIFNMVTSFRYLTTFNINALMFYKKIAAWYPWIELANWVGTEEAKRIKQLKFSVDYIHELDYASAYDEEENILDARIPHNTWNHNPLGNIKELEQLTFDVFLRLPQQLSDLNNGKLILENISTLELSYCRIYGLPRSFQHVNIDTVLKACPNITALGLAGIISTYVDMEPEHQDQLYTRLKQIRLRFIRVLCKDYITHLVNRCPNLSRLILHCYTIDLDPKNFGPSGGSVTIDAPNHSFELAEICGVRFNHKIEVKLLTVKQSSQNGGVAVDHGSKVYMAKSYRHSIHLNCRYAEVVVFKE
ncbi:hypothetical protein BC941DRAFT_419262 [Chlamydoabsidia padenii]|nr:hypothetical protein BC941DRAFT_419262 [Chlamydoabsidia padenii]